MIKDSLKIICTSVVVLFMCTGFSKATSALPSDYYPYNPRFADIGVGISVMSMADITTGTAGNPRWSALYSPMQVLENYGFNYSITVRPLNKVVLLKNFRFEIEGQYKESRYDILQDSSKNDWIPNKKDMPHNGKIQMNAVLFNGYYDFRWFSKIFYPYIGAGVGLANVHIRNLDYSLLPSGIGQQYNGSKKNTPITQFMLGWQYDTKIIKSSIFFEYRYTFTGSVRAEPKYNGRENQPKPDDHNKDKDKVDPLPPDYKDPEPKDIAFTAHAIVFGIKYYFY